MKKSSQSKQQTYKTDLKVGDLLEYTNENDFYVVLQIKEKRLPGFFTKFCDIYSLKTENIYTISSSHLLENQTNHKIKIHR